MLIFLLGMIAGAILIVAIAVVSERNKRTLDRKTDYESGFEDGYAEGLNDARWKGESDE